MSENMKKYPIPRLMLDSYLHPADTISKGYCLIPMPEDCPFKQKNHCTILSKVYEHVDEEIPVLSNYCGENFPCNCPLEDSE